jgi:hypothetical protein
MSWANPAAWLGIGVVALPIVIHLLGRRPARVLRVPTLRFVGASQILPRRRTRVQDPWLLAVRMSILALAVAAFAGPRLDAGNAVDARAIARAIVVDTSRSMMRATPAGPRALDVARQRADSLARGATVATTVEAGDVPRALPGASAWLARQGMRGEVVIVSDFDVLAIDSSDVARIPRPYGVRLSRVAVSTDSVPPEVSAGPSPALTLLAAPSDAARLRATQSAAQALVPGPTPPSADAIEIVFPSYPAFDVWRRTATPPRRTWMIDLVTRLRRDSLLVDAASLPATESLAHSPGTLAVAFDAVERPIIDAAVTVDRGSRLVLFSAAPAGSVTAAALVAAIRRSAMAAVAPWEADRRVIDDRRLAAWERAASADAPADVSRLDGGAGDVASSMLTRLLWGLALLLLAVETWLRRTRPRDTRTLIADDRAA